jgi:hypothetical protein
MVIKKLIAISVVFALVAGAAFAVDLGGAVIGSVNVVEKSGKADAEAFKGGLGRIRIDGSGEADVGIGTIGGWLRFDGFKLNAGGGTMATLGSLSGKSWERGPVNTVRANGLAWWQPIEQLRIQIGVNEDGHFDTSHIGRYGFYAQANEIGLVNDDGNWGNTSWDSAVFGGYSNLHFALIITPMDGVSINVAIPLNVDTAFDTSYAGTVDPDKQIAATFKGALFQVNYAADFGAIHLTYAGSGSTEWNGTLNSGAGGYGPTSTMGKFFASAYLGSLVDGLGLEFGLGFGIAANNASKPPLAIGLGAKYDVNEQFGVKLRSIFEIAMESGAEPKALVRVDLLPYYAINENVVAYFDAGLYIPAKSTLGWHFTPYVRVGAEWGASFYAGLKIAGNKPATGDSTVNIAIPVGIIASF